MPRYQVPQFIEEEAKIIGPLTLKQFLYLGGAAGISLLGFYAFNFFLWFLTTILAGAVGASLAFVRINGQPLPKIIFSALTYWQKPKEFIWKRETPTTTLDLSSIEKIKAARRNISLQDKIKSAALNIATGKFDIFSKNKKTKGKPKEKYQVVTHSTGERSVAKRVDYTN